jgi:hypothetical protein
LVLKDDFMIKKPKYYEKLSDLWTHGGKFLEKLSDFVSESGNCSMELGIFGRADKRQQNFSRNTSRDEIIWEEIRRDTRIILKWVLGK